MFAKYSFIDLKYIIRNTTCTQSSMLLSLPDVSYACLFFVL